MARPQLLTRSFGARRVAGFHPCSPLAKMDASFEARGRVVFCLCLPCDEENTWINEEFFILCFVSSTFFVTLCRSSQPIVAGRAMKNFMESRLSPPISPSTTGRVKKVFLLGGGRYRLGKGVYGRYHLCSLTSQLRHTSQR